MFDDEYDDNEMEAADASNFEEGERVIVDKGFLSQVIGTISFFFGDGYCEVLTDHGERLPVNVMRLSKNS